MFFTFLTETKSTCQDFYDRMLFDEKSKILPGKIALVAVPIIAALASICVPEGVIGIFFGASVAMLPLSCFISAIALLILLNTMRPSSGAMKGEIRKNIDILFDRSFDIKTIGNDEPEVIRPIVEEMKLLKVNLSNLSLLFRNQNRVDKSSLVDNAYAHVDKILARLPNPLVEKNYQELGDGIYLIISDCEKFGVIGGNIQKCF